MAKKEFEIATCAGHGCASNLISIYGNDKELLSHSVRLGRANTNKRTWQSARIQNLKQSLDLYDIILVFEPASGSSPREVDNIKGGIVFAKFNKDKNKRIVMDCFSDISYVELKKKYKKYAYFGPNFSYASIRPDTSIRFHEPNNRPNYPFPEVFAISQIFSNSNLGITRVCDPRKEGKIGLYVFDKKGREQAYSRI